MNKKNLSIGIQVFWGIALISSISAAGYFRSKYLAIKDQAPKVVTKTVVEPADTSAKDAEIAELKKQIENLEAKAANPKQEAVAQGKPADTQPRDRGDRQRFSLVELKEKDPERYQRIMESRTKMNEQMSKGVADKMVFFNDLDTSNMTEKELENHQKLLEKLAKMHEDTEKLGKNDNPAEIQDTMRAQWQNMREVSELMRGERDYLLMDAGRKMGFNEEEAKLLKDYVNNAYEITSGRSMFVGGARRGGGGDRGDNRNTGGGQNRQ